MRSWSDPGDETGTRRPLQARTTAVRLSAWPSAGREARRHPAQIQPLIEADLARNPRRLAAIEDYLLVTDHGVAGGVPAGWEAAARNLGDGVHLGRIDGALAERILDATELRGHDWRPTRQYFTVQGYARRVWSGDSGEVAPALHAWDSDGAIYRRVQLSRLVRDNATSTEHAARRLVRADGSDQLVPFDSDARFAYRLYPDQRGWLDDGEADELAALARAYFEPQPLPDRVGRALYRAESVTRQRYLQDALPLLVGGWESLVKIGRHAPGPQFAQRVPQIAGDVGVTISEQQCRDRYDDRSALVHGSGVDLKEPQRFDEVHADFASLQEALRRIVRRAIEEPPFAAEFADDARITARWPAVVTDRGRERVI
jgi:hypothetical protein